MTGLRANAGVCCVHEINRINRVVIEHAGKQGADDGPRPRSGPRVPIACGASIALVLNQIFRFAKRKGYISDPPVIAIPPSRQNSDLISRRRSA